MSGNGDSLQVRSVQYGAVGVALAALFLLAQTLTSTSEQLHASRATEEFREGQFAENSGHCDTAIEHYRAGLELADDRAQRLALARCLIKEGRISEGDAYLSQVLAADPTGGEANLLRAGLLDRAGAMSEAALFYERSTTGSWPAGDPRGRYRARSDLAAMLHRERRWRELIPQLMQLRETPGLEETRRVEIARMFLEAGAPGEAREILGEMTRRPEAQALLGRAYLALRQPQQAVVALRTAARLAPDDAGVARDLVFAEEVVTATETELARVALARMKRCAAFEDQLATEVDALLRRRVDEPRLRESIVEVWERSGPTCGAESVEERALEYRMPDLRPREAP